jgi:cellulose 1,4-beta-cellobiosidase
MLGGYGMCCFEMDIWEANSISTAYTPHTCSVVGQTRCEGQECGDIDDNNPESRYQGVCDKDGCDLNTYRYGIDDFFGPGSEFTIDSTKPMTVVTQFITTDGTDSGDLSEIRRFYVQDGQKIETPQISIPSPSGETKSYDSITDEFCAASRAAFNETHNGFKDNGAMKGMGDALDRGMVLVMSLWDDHYAHMLWLDSIYPTDKDPATNPGVARGTCTIDSGDPADVEVNVPHSNVTFSNIRVGTIGSTTNM